MTSMNNVVSIRDLCKSFGRIQAVSNLSLDIPEGSFFSLLGPNGAGKTTTLQTILNILRPSAGSATVLGTPSIELGEKEFQAIGYVSENQKLPEWMTINYFLSHCKSYYPKWDSEFCNSLVEQFTLPRAAKISSLSRGMKMKVSLISALSYYPKLLVLDEPFSGLDALTREELTDGLLQVMHAENRTVLISTHDIDEIEQITDRIAFLDKGRLRTVAATDELLRKTKRVLVQLAQAEEKPVETPSEWVELKQENRTISFVNCNYHKESFEAEIRGLLPSAESIQIQDLSLKEIFKTISRNKPLEVSM